MYIETSVAAPNSKAYMYSPWYYNTAQKCIQFFYHMYGNQIGSLDIYMQYSGSRYYYRVFSRSGNQNNTWHMGQLSVTKKGYFRVCYFSIYLQFDNYKLFNVFASTIFSSAGK